jgi:hypothetical protein
VWPVLAQLLVPPTPDDATGHLDKAILESAVFHYSADRRATFLASSVRHLAKHYLSMQAYYRDQGSLEAA